jgi:hypothetical protein
MRTLLTVLGVVGALASGLVPALARGWVTGDELLANCSANSEVSALKQARCFGYVTGVADVLGEGTIIYGFKACFTTGTTKGRLKDIVLRYLTRHPETRHFSAAGEVAASLSEAFPCPKK